MNPSILELRQIVQLANLADTADERTRRIVDSICEVIGTDVCSLYAVDNENNLVLLASHGLSLDKHVVIPRGTGLVGQVAQRCQLTNTDDASLLPQYHYIPGSKEDEFPGFCAVPVVNKGAAIAVLVVQSRQPVKLDPIKEAFLETLAAHLALLLENITSTSHAKLLFDTHISGVPGSPGIGIGTVKLVDSELLSSVEVERCTDSDHEVKLWQALLNETNIELTQEMNALSSSLSQSAFGVFDAYQMLLQDKTLIENVESGIRNGYKLTTALKLSIQYFSDFFSQMEDPYLKARNEDIRHLGNKLFRVWLKRNSKQTALEIEDKKIVLVGETLSISDIANLPPGKLVGIICCDGSSLSHLAVLANALGIPAVMGVNSILNFHSGETVIVNGHSADIIRKPSKSLLKEYAEILATRNQFSDSLSSLKELPAVTTDGVRVHLFANTGLQEDVMSGISNGAEGIGLYRTEIPFMARQSLPSEVEQIAVYQKVFECYPGKPIYVRTLDIGADKPLPYLPTLNEHNPALGLRGIRFTLSHIQLLTTQLRAIIQAAAGRDNIHMLVPMVSSTVELDSVCHLVDEAMDQLQQEGHKLTRPKIGVMVEVPAAISLLPFWESKIDFVSIGTNDLSQYLLAVDRNNPMVAKLHDTAHPAVLHEVQRVVEWSKKTNLPLCVCGEMASDPIAVMLLLGMGVQQLSMSSSAIPLIKSLIRSISATDARAFLATALAMNTTEKIRYEGSKRLHEMGFETPLGIGAVR